MALDFAGLAAITTQSPWDEIRAGKANDLRMVVMQEGLAQKNLQEQQAANAKIEEYKKTLSEISSKLLPPDVERLKGYEEELQTKLKKQAREGLMKSGGDVNKWFNGEGGILLNNYKQSLLTGEPTQTGLQNSFTHAQKVADEREGLIIRPIESVDAQGNPIEGSYDDQLKNYSAEGGAKAFHLKYNGAFKMPDYGDQRLMYSKVHGKNPYRREAVTPETHYQDLIMQGKGLGMNLNDNKRVAKIKSDTYAESLRNGGQPYEFAVTQYVPHYAPASSGNDKNAYISARANLDQWDAASDPTNKNVYNGVNGYVTTDGKVISYAEAQKMTIPQMRKLAPIQISDMVPVQLGKKTITYTETKTKYDYVTDKSDPTKQVAVASGTEMGEVTKEVDDAIEAPFERGGKVYFTTTADRLQGKPPQLFTDVAINKVVMGGKNTPDGLRMAAAYIQAAVDKGVLNADGTFNFKKNDKKEPAKGKGSYSNITKGTDPSGNEVNIGLKDGKWYNIDTNKPL